MLHYFNGDIILNKKEHSFEELFTIKNNETNFQLKNNSFKDMIEKINYSNISVKKNILQEDIEKDYKNFYDDIDSSSFEENCIFFIKDNSENKKNYKVYEIRELINNSNEFSEIISNIKNDIVKKNIILKNEQNILLKDLKKNKEKFTEIYQKIKNIIPINKIENIINIKTKYQNQFYDNLSSYIIEDYFDYGLLGKLMSEDAGKLLELKEGDFVTNLDIRDGWITYTTAFSRDRKAFNEKQLSSNEVEILVNKLLKQGESLSASSTSVNGTIPGLKYRLAVKHQSKTSSSTHVVSIRRQKTSIDMNYYMQTGFINKKIYTFMEKIINESKNIIFSGATGTGKTTLINTIKKEFIKNTESVIIIEDTPELYINGMAEVAFYSDNRQGSTDSDNFVDTLRHQPDRIILGEIRKPEPARLLIQAANTGNTKGTMTTIHANSAYDALRRLSDIMKEGNIEKDEMLISNKIRKSIDFVIQLSVEKIEESGIKKDKFLIKEIAEIKKEDPFIIFSKNINQIKIQINKLEIDFINSKNLEKQNLIKLELDILNTKLYTMELEMKYSLIDMNYILKWEKGIYKIDDIQNYIENY